MATRRQMGEDGNAKTVASTGFEGAACPRPREPTGTIVLGHGSGGKMTQDLIRAEFLPALKNPYLSRGDDAAVLPLPPSLRMAISTDSHVVAPLFFPGGDIGRLAVCGTVNDVAMMGARPEFLSAGFILEEGLEMSCLRRVIASMRAAAEEAGVAIVAGDTKVVEKGKADGLYINTTGVGWLLPEVEIHGAAASSGDLVILSGPIGDHGIAVLNARGELGLEADVASDVAPLNLLVMAMLEASSNVHVLRDPTRGGVAGALNEIARASNTAIFLRERAIPVRPAVQAACELLGFDPLYIANEGKLLAIVPAQDAEAVLEAMRGHQYGREAVIVGRVEAAPPGRVLMETAYGSTRVVDVPAGELLPRIC